MGYHRAKDKMAETSSRAKEYKAELAGLRVEQITNGTASKISQIKVFRKNIAVAKTVINLKTREELRKHYKGAKYVPLDLRVRKTRAQRRALTKHERAQKTVRQQKRDAHFARKVYAVKA